MRPLKRFVSLVAFAAVVSKLKVRGYIGFFCKTQTWVKGA